VGGIHGYENQCSLSLGGFIQFGSNQIQPKATFGISVSALNRITVTGIFVDLALLFSVGLSGFGTAQSRA